MRKQISRTMNQKNKGELRKFISLFAFVISNLENRQKSKTNKHKKMLVSCYWPIVSSEKLSLKLNSSEAYHGPWPQEQGSCFVKHLPMAASSNKKFLYWYHQLLYVLKLPQIIVCYNEKFVFRFFNTNYPVNCK